MMLYVVHGNTYYYGYGYIENIFGIYAKKDDAEAAKELITKKLYEKEIARGVRCLLSQIYQTSKWKSQKLKQADL